MSWIDQLNNVECEIITGEGSSFKPLWREAKRSKKYNTAAYNFIGVSGTLVDRQLPEGYQYDLVLIFQGGDHLTIAKRFQTAADDKRFWTITHPYWGEIRVQPLSIEEDKTILNTTIFKVSVWDTIENKYPIQKQLSNDRTVELTASINSSVLTAFESQIPVIDTTLRSSLSTSITNVDKVGSKFMTLDEDFAEFKTRVSKAKVMVEDVIQKPIDVMRAILDVVNYPVQAVQSVKDRIAVAEELLDKMRAVFLKDNSKQNLITFETQSAGLVGGIGNAAMNPSDNDYRLRRDVVYTMDATRTNYENYLADLDANQAERADDEDGFTANDDTARYLNELIMEALANIYDYSAGAKQERIIALEEDSNPIILTHRFYGLDKNDDSLSFFIDTNNLSLDELFAIAKGRRIAYYV